MRLLFMGSPAEVIAPLKYLLTASKGHHEVVGVVSQPARPAGRGGKMLEPPVAEFAKGLGIPLLQPEVMRDESFLTAVRALQIDVAITAAYGQILSRDFLAIPKRATINIHPSLLPRYRGATPVPAALLHGDTKTGVTILFTVKRLDAGNLILQEESPIGGDETAGELTARLFELGGHMLPKALSFLQDEHFRGVHQDKEKVTFCSKIEKSDGLVGWERPSQVVYNRFRAFEPWPGSYGFLGDKRVVITGMKLVREGHCTLHDKVGVASFDKASKSLWVTTGQGSVMVTHLKPAGGKVIDAAAFWNGLRDKERVVFKSEPSSTPGEG